MLALHFSVNSLAGAPIRLVRALAAHAGIEARLVDSKRFGLYDHDLIFEESPEEVIELAGRADIIHLHNFLDAESAEFAPIDFRALAKKGARLLRHFHSTPKLVAERRGITEAELLASPTPTIVIAQYPERLYPDAYVVPNLVPEDDPAYRPSAEPELWDVFYCPTKPHSAWENRWNTKGAPETCAMLARTAEKTGARINARDGSSLVPLARVMQEKARSLIVVDDLVNGSYHLSGLEGLCLGRAVLDHLDGRMEFLLRAFSGCQEHPFCNVRLEDAPEVLEYLVANPGEARDIGASGRDWIERYWSSARLAGFYREVYDKLLHDPTSVVRQKGLRIGGRRRFFVSALPEFVYNARRRAFNPQS